MPVKQRHLAVLGLTLAVAVVGVPASGNDKPKPPKPSARSLAAQPKLTPLEQYRLDLKTYLAAVEARRIAIDDINRRFSEAVKTAQKIFKDARAAAVTAEEKTSADSARKAAISLATAARQNALDELPPLPEAPEKPARPKPSPTPTSTP